MDHFATGTLNDAQIALNRARSRYPHTLILVPQIPHLAQFCCTISHYQDIGNLNTFLVFKSQDTSR